MDQMDQMRTSPYAGLGRTSRRSQGALIGRVMDTIILRWRVDCLLPASNSNCVFADFGKRLTPPTCRRARKFLAFGHWRAEPEIRRELRHTAFHCFSSHRITPSGTKRATLGSQMGSHAERTPANACELVRTASPA
jgi:hypothetical protein